MRDGFEKFIARSIRGDVDNPESTAGVKFLARILAAPSQQQQTAEEYIADLTGGSLQSAAELSRAISALGLARVNRPRCDPANL